MKQVVSTFVDVRDIATLHSLAILCEGEGVAGSRLFGASETFSWQQVYDVLNTATPPLNTPIPIGHPGESSIPRVTYNTAKVSQLFPGFQFRGLKESAVDLARQLEGLGWLG